MASWKGWEDEFLTAAQILITPATVRFLDEWHSHAETNCTRNPIDLTASVSGSTDCHGLPAINAKAQNYTTHGNAAHAFYVQTHRASSTALLAALKSGNPYTVSNTGNVAEDLTAWGSQSFAQFYFAETAGAPGRGGGGGGGGGSATHAHKGWNDLQRSVNSRLPSAVNRIGTLNRAALRALPRRRRVHH